MRARDLLKAVFDMAPVTTVDTLAEHVNRLGRACSCLDLIRTASVAHTNCQKFVIHVQCFVNLLSPLHTQHRQQPQQSRETADDEAGYCVFLRLILE